MTVARHILNRAAQFQWDSDSYPCKADNCRPTCAAMIAGFYKDRRFSPTYMRNKMQGGSNVCGPTNVNESVRGLAAVGVPARASWLTPAQVKAKLNAGIPVDIAVDYGDIPDIRAYITDFGFNGMHSVVACKATTGRDHRGNIVTGILVRDPDHGSPARPERPNYTFWPDSVWHKAFVSNYVTGIGWAGIAVYPKYKKVIPVTPTVTDPSAYVHTIEVITNDVNIRVSPWVTAKVVAQRDRGNRVTTKRIRKAGGTYYFNGVKRTDWLSFNRLGSEVWIARAFTKVIS